MRAFSAPFPFFFSRVRLRFDVELVGAATLVLCCLFQELCTLITDITHRFGHLETDRMKLHLANHISALHSKHTRMHNILFYLAVVAETIFIANFMCSAPHPPLFNPHLPHALIDFPFAVYLASSSGAVPLIT